MSVPRGRRFQIDVTVVLLADAGDRILTGDVTDLNRLVAAAETKAIVVAC